MCGTIYAMYLDIKHLTQSLALLIAIKMMIGPRDPVARFISFVRNYANNDNHWR